ncbi:transmembrane protein 220-like [Diadema setosum]|uniref:transmembrane protein 220-like n=1 Tax=Diadema setosum TaxID=31175 RepID=UPI003B3A45D2
MNSHFVVPNLWRLGNLLMAVFFGLASFVQHNDPDSEIWMLAYGIPAFLCLMQCCKPSISENIIWRYISTFHLVLCACGEAYILFSMYFTSTIAGAQAQQWFEREEVREFAGLFLVTTWLSLCIMQTKNGSESSPSKSIVCLAILLVITPFILWASMLLNRDYQEILPDHCKGSFPMPAKPI